MNGHKFAIVGCGQIAKRHAELVQQHGQLVAVCDIIQEKALAFASRFSCKSFTAIEQLLSNENKVEAVVICTPNGLHASHSIQALKAGKHVLCEKPMAITTQDASAMIRTEKETGKRLFVVKQNRYNPPVIFLKDLIERGKLGQIINFQMNCFWNRSGIYYHDSPWKGKKELDGGILFTQFSHFIDLLYWLLGDIGKVKGVRNNYLHKDVIEFEDTGVAIVELKNGAIGAINYTINSEQKNMEGSLTLFGQNGTVKIGGQYLNELEYFSVRDEVAPDLPKGRPANEYGFYQGSMSNHDKVYENMIKALDDPSYNFISSEETLKTIEIIEKIYKESPFLQ